MAESPSAAGAQPPLAGLCITEVLATSTGGVGTHVRSVLGPLRAAGAAVQVCGPRATDELFGFSGTGATFTPVEISAGLAPGADARAVAALRRALAGASLVHAHGLRAGLVTAAARRLAPGSPWLVLTLHNAVPERSGPVRRALSRLERTAVRSADVVLAASDDLADNARRQGARDVRLAPVSAPSLPPVRRTPTEVRAGLGVAEGQPLVVAVGRLHPQKGYDVLLDAAARWADGGGVDGGEAAPLVAIAGDGPLHEELAARIRTERLPVTLLGRRDDVADLLAAADVCVLPSRWEARSLTAQEALRAGTPLVATRTGGLPGLLGDAADLVPVGDVDALAGAVLRVLTDPQHAARLVEAGRRQAATWPDEAGTARELVALYGEVLRAPRR